MTGTTQSATQTDVRFAVSCRMFMARYCQIVEYSIFHTLFHPDVKQSVSNPALMSFTIPITLGPNQPCKKGTTRVGKCEPCNAIDPHAGDVYGLLANFDLRAVDAVCQGSLSYPVPAGFALARGECCVYDFRLVVYDRTVRSSGVNWADSNWPVKICNDLPAV